MRAGVRVVVYRSVLAQQMIRDSVMRAMSLITHDTKNDSTTTSRTVSTTTTTKY